MSHSSTDIRLKRFHRFLSTSIGFSYLVEADYIDREMDEWFMVSMCDARLNYTELAFCRRGICNTWCRLSFISKASLARSGINSIKCS